MEKSLVKRKFNTRQITVVGVLSAISIVLGALGIGFIPLPMAKATIMHIPVIIGAILEGFLLESLWEQGIAGKKVVYGYFGAALLLLVLFYPALTGLEVPQAYVDRVLNWFPKDWLF